MPLSIQLIQTNDSNWLRSLVIIILWFIIHVRFICLPDNDNVSDQWNKVQESIKRFAENWRATHELANFENRAKLEI